MFAPRLALRWLKQVGRRRAASRSASTCSYNEGDWVGAGEPMMYITGSFCHLVDLETIFLQKLGAACVAAYNACTMCADLPKVAFLAMDARHCAGTEMAEMMAYAAAVGSAAAKRKAGARGLHRQRHRRHRALLRPAQGARHHAARADRLCRHRRCAPPRCSTRPSPTRTLTVLVDYFGREVTDTLAVCRRFPDLAAAGRLGGPARHARRPLHRGAGSAAVLRRAGAPRAARRSAAIATRRSCAI